MTHRKNPFTATLGATPPYLAGRKDSIEEFAYALDDGPGSHERISLVVGPRGIGKTVLLNAFEDTASDRGWRILNDTASAGFAERLRAEIINTLQLNRTALKGFNLHLFQLGIGMEWDPRTLSAESYPLRRALKDLLHAQRELDRISHGEPTGVLITLDEMHHQRSDEVIDFGATIQHLVREGENIAVVMAGIPSSIKPLLASQDDSNPVTFLRRANRIELDRVADTDVRKALKAPVEETEVNWDKDALNSAVSACQGYPFMIQLVGLWAFRHRTDNTISVDAAQEGISKARRKLGQLVHEPALAELSPIDRTFLLHMAQDNGPSSMSDITARLGKSSQYASNYRRRLLDSELIEIPASGQVDFALPYLRDYLREHAASLVIDSY
ncbi:AAA family ATPase [Corynebacterium rhinophilum]|uniref:ATP-binding protein n=1 Tax=Corynebacterium TaxID=1716 RepID=UPI00254B3916|nr:MULTISPECIES: ATP-binding protein [unclassified Corynebacterium]MDK8452344.1 ATP-binding protein [Corynebacterium sp. MSK084]MDK8514403.1 ATP-binding protein [Corynebacterium sp. MSK123]MDK8547487.1 ATP-binding protein [Corynebacterium sp. MSK222]